MYIDTIDLKLLIGLMLIILFSYFFDKNIGDAKRMCVYIGDEKYILTVYIFNDILDIIEMMDENFEICLSISDLSFDHGKINDRYLYGEDKLYFCN